MNPIIKPCPVSACFSASWLQLKLYPLCHCPTYKLLVNWAKTSSNIEIIRSDMFEVDTDSQQQEEELFLQVDASEGFFRFHFYGLSKVKLHLHMLDWSWFLGVINLDSVITLNWWMWIVWSFLLYGWSSRWESLVFLCLWERCPSYSQHMDFLLGSQRVVHILSPLNT